MKKKRLMIIVFGLILIFQAFVIASLPEDKISSDVYKSLEKNNETRVVVDFKEEKKFAKENIINDIGKENLKQDLGDSISFEISKAELKELKDNPDVEKVKIDRPIKAFLQDSVPLVNATRAWPIQISGINITGIDETICIIDTGINFSHPALIGKNKTCVIDCVGKNCIENCSIGDDNGHGTHVAGIAAASTTINGVAIGANLIGVKVLNSAGSGSGTDLDAAISWCLNNSATYNISVISMSLGTDCDDTPQYCYSSYCDSDETTTAPRINNATLMNISVMIATGNDGKTSLISSPACIQNATAVGATDKSDNIASYSNRNSLTDLLAPGTSINSTKSNGAYESRQGTSMSAPHAAGAFALIRQFFRLQSSRILSPSEIQNALNSSGKIIFDSGSGLNFARINILSAIVYLDNTAPNVSLISPPNNQINITLNQSFYCNASDSIGLSNITFYLWNSTSLVYNETKNISGIFNSSVFNATNLDYKTYKWNCISSDLNGNSAFANSNFTLITEGISTSLVSPANQSYTKINNTNFTCNSNSGENFALTNITFYLWNSTGLEYNETKNISGNSNSSLFNYNFSVEGNYSWNCLSFNNASNSSFYEFNYSIVYDRTNPIINSVSAGSITSSSAVVNMTANENVNYTLNYGSSLSLGTFLINSSFSTGFSASLSSLSASTVYYYNITSCDRAGNCIENGTNVFTTSDAPVVQTSSGSGGGGGAADISKTYSINYEQGSKGYSKELSKNDKIKFIFFDKNAEEHSLIVNEIKANYVNLTIKSTPIYLILAEGQSAKISLTSSEYYDLFIKVDSIEDKKAKITIQLIHEEIPKPDNDKPITAFAVANPEEIPEKDEKERAENQILRFEINKIRVILIIAVLSFIFLGLIIMAVRNKSHKKKQKIKEYNEIFHRHINPKNIAKIR